MLVPHLQELSTCQAHATILSKRCLRRKQGGHAMAKSTPSQRKTAGRVMHEFKHGELKSGPGGKGGKVKSRKQAIAIALTESGASKYESKTENKRNLAKSKRKEAKGETGQQSMRASRMSALAESVSRPELWVARMPRVRPRVGARRHAPARAMVSRAKLSCISALRPGVSRTGPRCRSAN